MLGRILVRGPHPVRFAGLVVGGWGPWRSFSRRCRWRRPGPSAGLRRLAAPQARLLPSALRPLRWAGPRARAHGRQQHHGAVRTAGWTENRYGRAATAQEDDQREQQEDRRQNARDRAG